MIKCILINRSKIQPKNIRKKKYTNDIIECKIKNEYLPNVKIRPFKKEVPYYYNMMKPNELNKLFKAKYLYFSICDYYNLNHLQLFMITETSKNISIKGFKQLDSKYSFGNPKATFINKKHKVWNIAIFFLYDTKNNTCIDLSKKYFMVNIYNNASIKGDLRIATFESKDKIKLKQIKQDIVKLKNNIYQDILTDYNNHLGNIQQNIPSYDQLKKLIINEYKINKSLKSLSKCLSYLGKIDSLRKDKIEWMIEWKKNDIGTPLKRMIWKIHERINDLKYKNKLNKLEDIKRGLKKKMMKLFNKKERKETALKFLEYLVASNICTIEDTYIIYSTQLNYHYVKNANPWFQSGAYFHSLNEFQNLMIQLDDGVKITNNDSSQVEYMYLDKINIINDKKRFNKYFMMMKKHCNELKLK